MTEYAILHLPRVEVDHCLAKREPGEPIFVLLARDSAAPEAMEQWCEKREREIKYLLRPDTTQERDHIAQVRAKIEEFKAWRKANRDSPLPGQTDNPPPDDKRFIVIVTKDGQDFQYGPSTDDMTENNRGIKAALEERYCNVRQHDRQPAPPPEPVSIAEKAALAAIMPTMGEA